MGDCRDAYVGAGHRLCSTCIRHGPLNWVSLAKILCFRCFEFKGQPMTAFLMRLLIVKETMRHSQPSTCRSSIKERDLRIW